MGDMEPNWPASTARHGVNGGSGTPAQPHNLQPTICPAYKMCWCGSGIEIVGVANQWLVQPETHVIKVSPPLTLPVVLVLRGWMP